ncbi:NPC intracellular cholesterol transporter 2-like [Aricia agestis]|uniref:NPC intracellular cholesterol transporter 2-like n=1 Tax=Aricia agestis TaxID=91739 RepID=UPI001C2040A1|nr:NPC intracellular cholesterol transporter 2-like [Aricia agestis]
MHRSQSVVCQPPPGPLQCQNQLVPGLAMFVFAVLACCVAAAAATEVQQCEGMNIPGLSNAVQLVPCKKIPCALKKGTDTHITMTFTPEKDTKTIKNHVTALVFGVPLPFVGVDGNSVCDKLETESGEKASCPLSAGVKYVYKDSFPVLSFYPDLTTTVHWALKADDDKPITCFEVEAKIRK